MSAKVSQLVTEVPSQFFDLGSVDPSWHTPEYNRAFSATAEFETSIDYDGTTTVKLDEDRFVVGKLAVRGAKEEVSDTVLKENLVHAIQQIDTYYREHREIASDVVLSHNVAYRVGKARATTFHHAFTGNILPFSGVSLAHFDISNEDIEAVIINHRGTPTTVFTGPVRKVGPSSSLVNNLFGTYSRLTAPGRVRVPHDHAILLDRDTLHRQSAQFFSPFNPGVFLRSFISPLERSLVARGTIIDPKPEI